MSGAKRIAKELGENTENPPPGITVSLANESDVHKWNVVLDGPDSSPYAGGKFHLQMVLPTEYPFKAPVINFTTKIYHPNVTFDEKGSICIGVLKTELWKPSNKISSILTAIQQLLAEPNPDDPLENAIAEQFKTDRKAFDKEAKDNAKKYAGAK